MIMEERNPSAEFVLQKKAVMFPSCGKRKIEFYNKDFLKKVNNLLR